MKAIKLKETDLIAVVVPMDASHFTRMDDEIWYYIDSSGSHFKEDIGCDFEILGTCTKDHIDFDVHPFLEEDENRKYKSYPDGSTWFSHRAFRSLLSSNGLYFVNPYGEKRPYKEASLQEASEAIKTLDTWITAESNIVQKLFIIKPLK